MKECFPKNLSSGGGHVEYDAEISSSRVSKFCYKAIIFLSFTTREFRPQRRKLLPRLFYMTLRYSIIRDLNLVVDRYSINPVTVLPYGQYMIAKWAGLSYSHFHCYVFALPVLLFHYTAANMESSPSPLHLRLDKPNHSPPSSP